MAKHKDRIRVAVIGASGYTGADLIRLAYRHPNIELTQLLAKSHAGKSMDEVFPHLGGLGLPNLIAEEEADWTACDAVICGLPHGTAHEIIAKLPRAMNKAASTHVLKRWENAAQKMSMDTEFKPRPGQHCRWCAFAKSKGGVCLFG